MKESSLRDLDDKMKWLKNFERLLEIQVLLILAFISTIIVVVVVTIIVVVVVTIIVVVVVIYSVNNMIILVTSEMWSGPVLWRWNRSNITQNFSR